MNTINSYTDALNIREILAPYQMAGCHFLYRGHASTKYKLLSTAGRKNPINGNLLDSERSCLEQFKDIDSNNDWAKFKIYNHNTDLFYMSIGRHLGLDCRLLDWTARLETALFFAAENKDKQNEDGNLFILCHIGLFDKNVVKTCPFSIDHVAIIKEDYISPSNDFVSDMPEGIIRRFKQNGFFSITPSKYIKTPLNTIKIPNIRILDFIITANAKKEIYNKLIGYEEYIHLSSNIDIENKVKEINAQFFK